MIVTLILELLGMGAGESEPAPVHGGVAIFSDINQQAAARGSVHMQHALRGSPQWAALTMGIHQQHALRNEPTHAAIFYEWQ